MTLKIIHQSARFEDRGRDKAEFLTPVFSSMNELLFVFLVRCPAELAPGVWAGLARKLVVISLSASAAFEMCDAVLVLLSNLSAAG